MSRKKKKKGPGLTPEEKKYAAERVAEIAGGARARLNRTSLMRDYTKKHESLKEAHFEMLKARGTSFRLKPTPEVMEAVEKALAEVVSNAYGRVVAGIVGSLPIRISEVADREPAPVRVTERHEEAEAEYKTALAAYNAARNAIDDAEKRTLDQLWLGEDALGSIADFAEELAELIK